MKLVIDIDEDIFTRLFDNGIEDYAIANDDLFAIAKSIRTGTPLPKRHGRLIDEDNYKDKIDKYIKENKTSDDLYLAGCGDGAYHSRCMLDDISALIEAEKESE